MSRPNILLITDDQHRYDFFGHTNYIPSLNTPHLDRLRSNGISFPNSISNCPICMPTRFTWMHGLYASQGAEGLLRNAHDWPTHLPTFPQQLQKHGYHTALMGKLHTKAGLALMDLEQHKAETHARGFDDVVEVSGKSLSQWYDCDWTRHLDSVGKLDYYRERFTSLEDQFNYTDHVPLDIQPEDTMDGFIGKQAAAWLDQYQGDKPFFLHASFCGPHFPLDPPSKYWDKWKNAPVPAPEGSEYTGDQEACTRRRRAYCALIEQIDDEVGTLLNLINTRFDWDNTLIIYTCDHGDMLGHRNDWHKGKPYDTSARTPFYLHWPKVFTKGIENQSPVEAVDLPLTILDAAGIDIANDSPLPCTPGKSLLPAARDPQHTHRDYAFSECSTWRMIRNDTWKYIMKQEGDDELYHVVNDPWEANNLINEPDTRDQLALMQRQLLEAMSRIQTPNTIPVPKAVTDPKTERLSATKP